MEAFLLFAKKLYIIISNYSKSYSSSFGDANKAALAPSGLSVANVWLVNFGLQTTHARRDDLFMRQTGVL